MDRWSWYAVPWQYPDTTEGHCRYWRLEDNVWLESFSGEWPDASILIVDEDVLPAHWLREKYQDRPLYVTVSECRLVVWHLRERCYIHCLCPSWSSYRTASACDMKRLTGHSFERRGYLLERYGFFPDLDSARRIPSEFYDVIQHAPAANAHGNNQADEDYLLVDDLPLPACCVCGLPIPRLRECPERGDESWLVVEVWQLRDRTRNLVRNELEQMGWYSKRWYVCDDGCAELAQWIYRQEYAQCLQEALGTVAERSRAKALPALLRKTRQALKHQNLAACKSLREEYVQLQTLHP